MKDRQKGLRRSLWVSALAIVLCCAMLVGTTFAWFTDSVSSSGNRIQAGTLTITATAAGYDQNGSTQITVPDGVIAGNTLIFGAAEDIEAEGAKPVISESNWEPGQRNAKLLTVTNSGSLAAKIKLEFNVTNGELTDALWFDFIQVNENSATGQFTQRDMSTLNDLAGKVELPVPAGGSVSFVLVYGMKESAGNEYQGKGFEASVSILAKQDTVEEDGFGNDQYDKDAVYPVASNQELADKIASAQPGETVLVAAGDFELPAEVKEGVTIQGSGVDTKLTVPVTASGSNATGLVVDKSDFSIRNVTLVGSKNITGGEYFGAIDIRNGGTVLDGVTFSNIPYPACAVVIKNGVDDGENVTISNTVIPASLGLFKAINIVDGANGTINIVDSDITAVYTFNVNSASSQNLVINVTGSKLHGWTSYGDIKSASFTDTEFSKGNSSQNFMRPYADTTLTNCTFDATFKMGAGADGKTITIENCTYNGTKLTAKNVQELLLDMSGIDEEHLRACTILVDGEKATLT